MRKINLRWAPVFIVLAAIVALLPQSVRGQNQVFSYNFPGVVPTTEIAIANINNQTVTTTVAFYRPAGDVVSTTISIDPGKQTRLNSATAGITDFTSGSVVITSPLPLSTSASDFEGDTAFDFFFPSEPSATLV